MKLYTPRLREIVTDSSVLQHLEEPIQLSSGEWSDYFIDGKHAVDDPEDLDLVGSAMLSTIVATAVSTVPAYYLNRAWTWGKRGKSHLWKEVVPFWAMAFIGLVLATVIVGLAAKNADRISTAPHFKTLLVHFAYLFSYGLIWVARYSVMNRFLFGSHTHERAAGTAVDTVAVERTGSQASTSVQPTATGTIVAPASTSTHGSASVSASVGAGTEAARPVDPSS